MWKVAGLVVMVLAALFCLPAVAQEGCDPISFADQLAAFTSQMATTEDAAMFLEKIEDWAIIEPRIMF